MYTERVLHGLDSIAKEGGELELELDGSALLGVVAKTMVERRGKSKFTWATFLTSGNETLILHLRHNAGLLLGRMCIYIPEEGLIWPVGERAHVSETTSIHYSHLKLLGKPIPPLEEEVLQPSTRQRAAEANPAQANQGEDSGYVRCHVCSNSIRKEQLGRHLRKHLWKNLKTKDVRHPGA